MITAKRVVGVVAALLVFVACGGPAKTETADTAQAEMGAPCDDYARRMCTELSPSSDSCRSVLSVVALLPDSACAAGLDAFETTTLRIAELRKACQTVAEQVCAEFGEDSQSCQALKRDLPEIPPGHCGALLRDQPRLIAMLKEREAAGGPLTDEQWKALTASNAPSFGAQDAAVVAVVFSDFECPYCAESAKVVQRLKTEYGARIRLVFRQYPLAFHPHAKRAAQAALAAHDQGKFWEFHDLLFAHQDALDDDALLAYARELGLKPDSFQSVSKSEATEARVAEDVRLGESVQVRGTPTLFIDKERIDNPTDYDVVSQAIEGALKP